MPGDIADCPNTRNVGDLTTILSGFPFKSERFTTSGDDGMPLIRIRDLKSSDTVCRYVGDFDPAYVIKKGDVVVGMDGEFLAIRWNGANALLNQRVLKLRSSAPDLLDDDYLFHRIQPELARLEETITGTTVKHLSTKDIKRLVWDLPPLDEQRRIAEVLRSVDEAIRTQSDVCDQIQATFNSLAEASFTVSGDNKNVGWPMVPLGEVCESIQVGIVVRPASYYVEVNGIPALRSLNVGENHLDLSDLVYISEEGHRLNSKSSLRSGDVVTRRTGEPGKTAVIPPQFPDGLNCIDIIFTRPKAELRAEFLSFFMNSDAAKRQVAGVQGGLAQQHLNVGEMKKLSVPVPPAENQDEVVALLRAAWDRVEVERAFLNRLSSVRSAIADDLLSGRIRVPA